MLVAKACANIGFCNIDVTFVTFVFVTKFPLKKNKIVIFGRIDIGP